MYRCIECKTVFENKPEYCDCGNDTFEAVVYQSSVPQQNNVQFSSSSSAQNPLPKKTYNPKEIISIVIFSICIILSIFAWIFVGNDASGQRSSRDLSQQGVNEVSTSNIPDINDIWDATLPTYKQQSGQPVEQAQPNGLLNKKMATLSPEMTNYVLILGQTFVAAWPRGSVVGDGSCEIEFSIDKDGRVVNKKIYKASNNKTLDDSVSIMMENITQTSIPPADYQGENIIMAFSILHREFKVFYPHY